MVRNFLEHAIQFLCARSGQIVVSGFNAMAKTGNQNIYVSPSTIYLFLLYTIASRCRRIVGRHSIHVYVGVVFGSVCGISPIKNTYGVYINAGGL